MSLDALHNHCTRMQSTPLTLALALALLAGAAPAAGTDPTQSADCRRALESLQAKEDALIAARQSGDARDAPAAAVPIDTLRRQSARACLGGSGVAPAPKQSALPPIVVPPVRSPRPAPPPAARAAPAAPAPQRAGPPVFISSCDTDACWASDGTRLLRAGTRLVGPRGLCSGSPGTPLSCP